ncbi:helix-turn-helix transcriptional regulator [Roseibium alexandrii]|uniref:Putative transcriptional regulator n=1 Tax=Roseibium alexandrii (strain DSM 17067 / NCIMB 14079 / DFL-11) TaxID=244592 RepID=A0A5E8GUC0_ROSAD|nr:hypothetical protein [Roseibium alexandrii]EEE43134.2 putative transcriptional regulator [Roseibium alexandrii DFL-11]
MHTIDITGVAELCLVSERTAEKYVAIPTFPAAMRPGGRSRIWDRDEVVAWLRDQKDDRQLIGKLSDEYRAEDGSELDPPKMTSPVEARAFKPQLFDRDKAWNEKGPAPIALKISEVIDRLGAVKSEHGDIAVFAGQNEITAESIHVDPAESHDNFPGRVCL